MVMGISLQQQQLLNGQALDGPAVCRAGLGEAASYKKRTK